jgi:hypothetical protein
VEITAGGKQKVELILSQGVNKSSAKEGGEAWKASDACGGFNLVIFSHLETRREGNCSNIGWEILFHHLYLPVTQSPLTPKEFPGEWLTWS